MKTISKLSTLAIALVVSFSSLSVQANPDKALNKAKAAVEQASPDDWETYANSAKTLIQKKAYMAEAKKWIETSLSIKETAFNLEIMGDYYMKNKLPKKAMSYYIQSMNKLKEKDATVDTSNIQDKILKAKAM